MGKKNKSKIEASDEKSIIEVKASIPMMPAAEENEGGMLVQVEVAQQKQQIVAAKRKRAKKETGDMVAEPMAATQNADMQQGISQVGFADTNTDRSKVQNKSKAAGKPAKRKVAKKAIDEKAEATSVMVDRSPVMGGEGVVEEKVVASNTVQVSLTPNATVLEGESLSKVANPTIAPTTKASSVPLEPGLYRPSITKEEVSLLPIMATDLEIVTVDKKSQVQKAIDDLMDSDLIGFDTETRPSFVKGVRNTVSLLQLSNARRCYLFRLQMLGKNNKIKELLENPNVRKVGLSVRDDFRALSYWMEMTPSNFIELQTYVRAFGIEEMSLQKVFAIVFNHKISKRQQLSNWEARTLSEAQQLYAATDAWACREIYFKLRKI